MPNHSDPGGFRQQRIHCHRYRSCSPLGVHRTTKTNSPLSPQAARRIAAALGIALGLLGCEASPDLKDDPVTLGAGQGCNTSDTSVSLPLPANYEGWCNPGQGVMTGTYGNPNWVGSATARWGQPGRDFSVEFDNQQAMSDTSHQEFDISQKRDLWTGRAQGYGEVRIADALERDLRMTHTGRWEWGPFGRTHINVIIWLNRNFQSESKANHASIDVTITDWHHEGKDALKAGQLYGSMAHLGQTFHEGSNYQVYRRTGDLNEKASYLIIRDDNRESGQVDPGFFLAWLLDYESSSNTNTFDGKWFIGSMGWEITGQAAGFDKYIGNGSGKYAFSCYSIPSLNGDENGAAFERCSDEGPPEPESQGGYVFSRTDVNELRWITDNGMGQLGSIWIDQACSQSLGGPTSYGDWFDLMEEAPGFDTVSNPCD